MKIINPILLLLVVLPALNALSQKNQNYTGDTVKFERFHGEERYQYFTNEELLPVKNGKYTFASRLLLNIDSNQLYPEKLRINGNYKSGKRHGNFHYAFGRYEFLLNGIEDGQSLVADYDLNGYKREYHMNYSEGVPEGRWRVVKTRARNGRFQSPHQEVGMRFFKGTIIDNFQAEMHRNGSPVKITGSVNTAGFFHGNLSLEYHQDGLPITEQRIYEAGYLLQILKRSAETGDTISFVSYGDVQNKLEECRADSNNKTQDFEISDEGFGVHFDNGYSPSSIKVKSQEYGNEQLEELFHVFDDFHDSGNFEVEKPVFNLTARFKYVYPEKDDSLSLELFPVVKAKQEELKAFLNSPQFIIAKERSDSMALAYAFVQKSAQKTAEILDVVQKVKTGYFDFLNRNLYYKHGVPELQNPDTVRYTHDDKQKELIFDPGSYVTSSDSLLPQLISYMESLKSYTRKQIEFSERQIVRFEQQDFIDSLDREIVTYRHLTDSLYAPYKDIEKAEDQPIDYRMYRNIEKDRIKPLYKSYVKEESFDPKKQTGEKLACLLKTLYLKHDSVRKIEDFPDSIEKTFTEFRRNPFDNRELESKFLGGISRAGKILLRHYVENMFKASDCEEYTINLEKSFKLKALLNEKASNKEDDDVQRLNRGLRRETVPSRIERLMGM